MVDKGWIKALVFYSVAVFLFVIAIGLLMKRYLFDKTVYSRIFEDFIKMVDKGWLKTKAFKKWSSNVQSQRKTRRVPSKKDLCSRGNFCKGAKDIPRRLMPQIYDASKFAKLIKAKYKVKSHKDVMVMTDLKPSQNEISKERVESVIEDIKSGAIGNNPLVVSQDGYIVDGHHRWAAYKKYSPDKKLPVLVIELPIQDALGLATAVSSAREKF